MKRMSANQHSNLPAAEVIRSFLLGGLDAAAQEEFEARLMMDDRLHELVRQAELKLADDAASGRIERSERQLFARNFLLTDERRQIVVVSEALHEKFGPSDTPRVRMSWREMFRQPALRVAFGLLVALLLVGSFLIVTKQPRIVRTFFPRPIPIRRAPISQPQEVHHPTNQTAPLHRESDSSPLEHESTPPNSGFEGVVTVSPSVDLNQAPTIALPNGGNGAIRCQLTLSQTETNEFQVELWSLNQNVFVIDSAKSNGNQLEVDVPVRVLKAGDYEIRVSRVHDGSRQPVATYYFGVR